MPPIKPMPSAAAPRQTDPDYHKDCAAQFAQGVAPWPPRHSKTQRREAAIGCHILNRMAELGRPSSYALGR